MDWKTRKDKLQDNGSALDTSAAALSNSTPRVGKVGDGPGSAGQITTDAAGQESTGPQWVTQDFSRLAQAASDFEDTGGFPASGKSAPGLQSATPQDQAVSLDAFAPYQPEHPAQPDPEPDGITTPFVFQSMGQFPAPVEPDITEATTIFANHPQGAGAPVPKVSDRLAGSYENTLDVGESAASFTSGSERETVASGLVSNDDEFGIPRVAPFIVDVPGAPIPTDEATTDRVLILKVRNLSATYPLVNVVTTMGRPDAQTQNYPDVEIELDDSVSRKHAEIRRKNNEFYLVDLGSTNGTMLNGQALRPGTEMPLQHGDRIRMGEKTEIVFE